MKISKCFLDSSSFIALNHSHDRNFAHAQQTASMLNECNYIVSELVVSETYTFMRYRMGFQTANRFLRYLFHHDKFTIYEPTETVRKRTHDILEKYSDHKISYCDAMSVAIMKELEIRYIFSYGHDFTKLGVERINDMI